MSLDAGKAGFAFFVSLWNGAQGQKTPDLHFRIAAWLEGAWQAGDTQLLLMVFRSAGKSTLTGLFCAWLLQRDPNLRILVLAADQGLAGKMVRNVKRIIERHPLCTGLKPDRPDQWASDRFTVQRGRELRDPSMLARGIGANLTGSRADVIICDDVEVPNTCDSAEKRADLRERLAEVSYILVPGGLQLYVGTPHHYYSLYAREAREDIGEDTPFLDGFKRLEIPVLDERGQSAWAERFSLADINAIKAHTGAAKFRSQMMLVPTNILDGRLCPDLLRRYGGGLSYSAELRRLYIGDVPMAGVSAYWDPAFGAGNGDHSVLAAVYSDENGRRYIHSVCYLQVDAGAEIDEATQQCQQVAKLAKDLRLPALHVEVNGIGRFLPGLLRQAMKQAGAVCRVIEVHQSRKKELRILEAFDTALAAQRLYVHDSVFQTPFIAEIREWRPDRNRGHDDGLDAVAGALLHVPDVLPSTLPKGAQNWMKTKGRPYKAQTDFSV